MPSLVLTDSQDCVLTIAPVDKKGNPAPIDGVPEWFSSNTDVLTITPAADGLSATASAVGALGDATVNVNADADMGAGTTAITGTIDITVEAGAATTVAITPSTPTEQP